MITNNPYNLPDKMLKPNQISKPIALQSKKSRDRSYDYSKQAKGIKIQSQMKKSMNLQHITSSPNLHTVSTSSSSNRLPQQQQPPRPLQYHQPHIPQQQPSESQHDRRIKFLLQKFYQISEQLTSHDLIINKFFLAQKQKGERNSWESPFQINSLNSININQRESRDRDEMMRKQQAKSFHINQVNGQQGNGAIQNNDNSSMMREVQQLRKQFITMKQQLSSIKNTISRQRDQQSTPININKSVKLNNNGQFQNTLNQRKFTQQLSRVYQTIQQLKFTTQQKCSKLQANTIKLQNSFQLTSHKVTKAQQRIQNLESSIQNHMNLVNQQINNALTKIVTSINQKISKALQNNVGLVNEKLKKCVQTCRALAEDYKKEQSMTLKPCNIQGKLIVNSGTMLKLSGFKAEGKVAKIKMKSVINMIDQKSIHQKTLQQKAQNSPSKDSTTSDEIIFGNTVYYIDSQGYLLDENQVYLLDQENRLLQLQGDKLNKIKQLGFLV